MKFENVSAFTLAVIAFAPALILLFIHLPRIFFPKEKNRNDTSGPEEARSLERKAQKKIEQKKSRGHLEYSAG